MWIEFKKYYLIFWITLYGLYRLVLTEFDSDLVIPIPCTYKNNYRTHSCNCNFGGHVMELQLTNGSIGELEITNCNTLIIRPRAFSKILDLKIIKIINVNELEIGEYAFDLPKNTETHIRFDRVNIKSVPSYSFMGSIRSLTFHNMTIEEFKPYSVSLLSDKIQTINITHSVIGLVQAQAFKKFITEEFIVADTVFQHDLQSRAFSNIEVTSLLSVTNCKFTTFLPNSFKFDNVPVFRFNMNQIHKLNEESMNVSSRSVEINNNNFSYIHARAFINFIPIKALTLWERHQQSTFIFNRNSLENIDARWHLELSNEFAITKLTNIEIVAPKTCTLVKDSEQNSFLRENSHEIYLRSSSNPQQQITLSEFSGGECRASSYLVYAYIGLAFLIFCVILIIIFVVIYFHRQRQKIIQARMVSPEPRTYRETQIVVKLENHNLLKTDF